MAKMARLRRCLRGFLDPALEVGPESHLDEAERLSGNRKNGRPSKEARTSGGTISVIAPRDRSSAFGPGLIRRRGAILAESPESKILGMYGLGMGLRDISKHIKDMYGTEISYPTLSAIADKIIPEVKEWQSRPLEELYTIVWLGAMHYKVKEGHRMVPHAVSHVVPDVMAIRVLLGVYAPQSEGANFWVSRIN